VALLLDGRGDLTPLQVKIALQASADFMPAAGLLVGGAGSLDLGNLNQLPTLHPTRDSVDSAFSLSIPNSDGVSSQIIVWGNIIVWGEKVTWGEIIVWGQSTQASDIIVWGNSTNDIIVWGNSSDIIVWGNTANAQDIIVWGNSASDIIVWGNSSDIIVWGNAALAD
jgi:hypothetical protein